MIDTSDWKEFRVDEVFAVKGGFYNKKPEHSVEGTIPFLAATDSNNGVTEFYSLEDIRSWDKVGNRDDTLDKKIFKAPAIAVTVDGSCGSAYYQSSDYTCSHSVTSLRPRDGHELTVKEGLFCCTVIEQEKYRWSYGRKPHDVTKLSAMTIKLPADIDGNPDWTWMAHYMDSLSVKPITTAVKSSQMPLGLESWKEFRFGDLLEVPPYKGLAHKKEDFVECLLMHEKVMPYVTRTELNNSVDMQVVDDGALTGIEEGNALVVGDTTATISYQPLPFVCGDHIVVIRAEWLNVKTGLFVVGLLRQERFRYSYGRAFVMNAIEDTLLRLPVDADGNPDWAWMEQYMSALPYSDRIC